MSDLLFTAHLAIIEEIDQLQRIAIRKLRNRAPHIGQPFDRIDKGGDAITNRYAS